MMNFYLHSSGLSRARTCHGPEKRHQLPCSKRRSTVAARSSNDDSSDIGDSKPDIDALAAYLSREAARLRAADDDSSISGTSESGGSTGYDINSGSSRLLEPQTDEIEDQLFEQVDHALKSSYQMTGTNRHKPGTHVTHDLKAFQKYIGLPFSLIMESWCRAVSW